MKKVENVEVSVGEQKVQESDNKVSATKNSDGTIKIRNSYSVKTPLVRYAFSFWLNHFSEYSDDIGGSTGGIAYEWELHNVAYNALSILEVFGADVSEKKKQARDVDVGYTIFADKHKFPSFVMKVLYCVERPFSALIDGIIESSSH